MSVYKPTMRHLQEVLLYYFNSYETAAEAYRMLVHAYGNHAICLDSCYKNFARFGRGNFNLNRITRKRQNKERVIEELVRLKLENPGITQAEMAAKVGVSKKTVFTHLSSQEYQNKLKEKELEQSLVPLDLTVKRRRTDSDRY